jgi:Uma2 family endonuclease
MAHLIRREIILPETKPETEWLRGRAVRKMSPLRDHAALQKWWLLRLSSWAAGRGEVYAEWRFRVAAPGEDIRPLVPDVAYLSFERMGDATVEEIEAPLFPPNVAVEIRSPGDSRADLEDKIAVFLRAGADVVIVVNPRTRTVVTWDATRKRVFFGSDVFGHPALPEFQFTLTEMFDALAFRRPR